MSMLSPCVHRLILVCALIPSLAGCSFLKPSGVTPRSFLLAPAPASAPSAAPAKANPNPAAPGGGALRIGMRPVNIPAYLLKKSIAMRQQTNEIVYLETAVWAERLDLGLQRVLAVSLGTSLATDQIRLSAWRPEEVSFEVHITVEQFDVDVRGEGVLAAWWRILAPGGDKVLAAGRFSATRQGPSPQADPQAAVASMSALAVELAQDLAREVKQGKL